MVHSMDGMTQWRLGKLDQLEMKWAANVQGLERGLDWRVGDEESGADMVQRMFGTDWMDGV